MKNHFDITIRVYLYCAGTTKLQYKDREVYDLYSIHAALITTALLYCIFKLITCTVFIYYSIVHYCIASCICTGSNIKYINPEIMQTIKQGNVNADSIKLVQQNFSSTYIIKCKYMTNKQPRDNANNQARQ